MSRPHFLGIFAPDRSFAIRKKLQELLKKYKAIPAADPSDKKGSNKVKTTQN